MFICKRCCCTSKKSGCCSPKELDNLSSDLTVISVKSRLEILFLLRNKPHCVCDLMSHTGMSQSLISHHMADLEKFNFITGKKDGKYIDYALTFKGRHITSLLDLLLSK
jgi:DNA-binding transcriptional ArsR family regulator